MPFACAKGGLTSANLCMYSPITVVVATLAKEIRDLESANKIDSSSNLSGSKVFVYHGTKDTTVNPGNQIILGIFCIETEIPPCKIRF